MERLLFVSSIIYEQSHLNYVDYKPYANSLTLLATVFYNSHKTRAINGFDFLITFWKKNYQRVSKWYFFVKILGSIWKCNCIFESFVVNSLFKVVALKVGKLSRMD